MITSCWLVEEGVLVFGGSPRHPHLQEVSTLAASLEDGLLVVVGSSAKGTGLAFVAVLTHFCASAKLSLRFGTASPLPQLFDCLLCCLGLTH